MSMLAGHRGSDHVSNVSPKQKNASPLRGQAGFVILLRHLKTRKLNTRCALMENGFAVYTGGFIGGTDRITLLPAMTALQGQAPFLRKKGKAAFAATWASVKQKRPLASQ